MVPRCGLPWPLAVALVAEAAGHATTLEALNARRSFA